MENNLLPQALVFLARGYAVIPVGDDKRPLVQWKDYQTRKPTNEELVEWWTRNPEAQIGIVTGQISNLTVIDIEKDGDFNLIPEVTYMVQTGGGGRHYYFQYETEFKNAVRMLPSVDVRSEGGYVVAAGSRTQKGGYFELNNVEVIQMPSQIRKTFLEASRGLPALNGKYPKISTEGLEYLGAAAGARNDSMAKYAGLIHAKLHSSLWSSLGLQLFVGANKENNPPLEQKELMTIWESIGGREMIQNPEGRKFLPQQQRLRQGDQWGPFDSIAGSDEVDRLFEAERNSRESLHVSEVAKLQVIDTDHTYPIDMQPFDEALLGGFTAGELIVVAGTSGSGKTSLLQDWSVTLASGGQTKTTKLPTLWFSYEVYPKPLWQKFEIMGANQDTPLYMPRFNESGEFKWVMEVVEEAIRKWDIKIVVIDHLGFLRAPKGNYANEADAITYTVRAMRGLAKKYGLIIMFQVHVKKTISRMADLSDIKGSSGIAQEADTVFFIAREKDDSGLATSHAKVSLIKNRKTGMMVSAMLDYQFGRYFFDVGDMEKKLEEDGGFGGDGTQVRASEDF